MRNLKAGRSEAGVALITALIIVIIVGGMAAAFLTLSFSQSNSIAIGSEREVALHIAESGVEDTINKLTAYSRDYVKAGNATPVFASPAPDYALIGQPIKVVTVTGTVNAGTYSAAVADASGLAVDAAGNPVAFGGPFFAGGYLITSAGTHGKLTRTLEVLVQAVDLSNPFKYGLFGDVEVDALGTFQSDGYDSSKGVYNASKTYTFPDGKTVAYADATGNVGSNGNIVTNGNVVIMGNATPGPAGSSGPGGDIQGSTTPSIAPQQLDPVVYPTTFPSGTGTPPVSGPQTYLTPPSWTSNVGVTIPGGTAGAPLKYHMSDFKNSGKGAITITGEVVLYVDGTIDMNNQQSINLAAGPPEAKLTIYQGPGANDLTINGQAVAGTASADRFQIYSATTGTIKFNGGSKVYGAIYAPGANFINNGGNEFYGSMVAKTMKLSGTASFHYDENLAKLSTPKPDFKIMSWVEIPNK
jgi:hypothetical protein